MRPKSQCSAECADIDGCVDRVDGWSERCAGAISHPVRGVQAGREAAGSRPDARRRVILSLPLPYSSRHLGDVTPARDASDLSANNRTQLSTTSFHDDTTGYASRTIPATTTTTLPQVVHIIADVSTSDLRSSSGTDYTSCFDDDVAESHATVSGRLPPPQSRTRSMLTSRAPRHIRRIPGPPASTSRRPPAAHQPRA